MSDEEFRNFMDMGKSTLSDGELTEVISNVIAQNAKAVQDYKNGKENSLQFLLGQVMRETKGNVNPAVVIPLIKEALK